jgi:SAM-dependent methyltransferase
MVEFGMGGDHSEETRAIYHAQHQRIVADDRAMARFIGMFSEKYFGLPKGWFANKSALDAGCGDTAKLLIALHRMGCRDLHGFDLGDEFIPVARSSLARRAVPGNAVQFRSGSVLAPPYEPESFDFVACHGVLVHLNSLAEVRDAFPKLARLVKPGGYLYTVYGSVGGLFEGAILPAIRGHYRSNADFRDFIDGLQPEHLMHLVRLVEQGIEEHEGERIPLSALFSDMIDEDLCVFFQNVTQVPVRLEIDEEMIRAMHRDAGLDNPQRLKRYVLRKNIRRFFAPLHYQHDDRMARLLYGSGNFEFIAQNPPNLSP